MGDPFCCEQQQGKNRESNLKALGIELLLCDRLLTPLGRRLVSQSPDSSHYIKIGDGAKQGEDHHGNADGIPVKSVSGSMDACGGCECA